ncbi:hypothetical protein AB6A40_003534 [Gnathostoma spinigerum]|uniref:Uncharacterized protein n=1 Tax=Gnathostoma spinigerum TaxID=75299 RepID=A0ABD6EB11_9BILA
MRTCSIKVNRQLHQLETLLEMVRTLNTENAEIQRLWGQEFGAFGCSNKSPLEDFIVAKKETKEYFYQ